MCTACIAVGTGEPDVLFAESWNGAGWALRTTSTESSAGRMRARVRGLVGRRLLRYGECEVTMSEAIEVNSCCWVSLMVSKRGWWVTALAARDGTAGYGAVCSDRGEGDAVGEADTGYVFVGWIGCKHAAAGTCEVDVTAASEVTAVF